MAQEKKSQSQRGEKHGSKKEPQKPKPQNQPKK